MALSVILVLYMAIGLLAAVGSVVIARWLFSREAEQAFFAWFLIPIAGFYLAFTAYFGDPGGWRLEIGGVAVFTLLGLLGVRVPLALIVGYLTHGLWDVLHELHMHAGVDPFGALPATEIPLAYGAFCLTYDGSIAAYFLARVRGWKAPWRSGPGAARPAR